MDYHTWLQKRAAGLEAVKQQKIKTLISQKQFLGEYDPKADYGGYLEKKDEGEPKSADYLLGMLQGIKETEKQRDSRRPLTSFDLNGLPNTADSSTACSSGRQADIPVKMQPFDSQDHFEVDINDFSIFNRAEDEVSFGPTVDLDDNNMYRPLDILI